MKVEDYTPMMKPRSIATLMAHPPMADTMTYIQKLRNRRPDAMGLVVAMLFRILIEMGCIGRDVGFN